MRNLSLTASQAFDSGNYDNAYESESPAYCRREAGRLKGGATREAYIAGFYSSYELHEIPDDEHRDIVSAWRDEPPDCIR